MNVFVFFLLTIRRPPRSTRTDTLVPYPTLFLSVVGDAAQAGSRGRERDTGIEAVGDIIDHAVDGRVARRILNIDRIAERADIVVGSPRQQRPSQLAAALVRRIALPPKSGELRLGQERVSTCRSRWRALLYKKKNKNFN